MNGKQKKIVIIMSAISLPLGAIVLAYYNYIPNILLEHS